MLDPLYHNTIHSLRDYLLLLLDLIHHFIILFTYTIVKNNESRDQYQYLALVLRRYYCACYFLETRHSFTQMHAQCRFSIGKRVAQIDGDQPQRCSGDVFRLRLRSRHGVQRSLWQ